MTQQTGTGDRGEDAAAYGDRECGRDLPSGGMADPRRASGTGPALTRLLSFHPEGTMPMQMWTDLTRLECAFPDFSFAISEGRHGPRFEAWRGTTQSGLYAVITDDPCELWRELGVSEP